MISHTIELHRPVYRAPRPATDKPRRAGPEVALFSGFIAVATFFVLVALLAHLRIAPSPAPSAPSISAYGVAARPIPSDLDISYRLSILTHVSRKRP